MRTRTRRAAAVFETCESRQHMAADLIVSAISADRPLMPFGIWNSLNVTVSINNTGTSAVPSGTIIDVTLYAVDNLYTTPTPVGGATVAGDGVYETKTLTIQSSLIRPVDNDGYLFAVVDSANSVAESNETNNSYRGIGLDMLRYSMDGDVSAPAGSVTPRSLGLDGNFVNGAIGDEMIGRADIDTYKVTLQAGTKYWFEMDATDHDFFSGLRLIDQQYTTLASSTSDAGNNSTQNAYIEYTPAVSGDYFLAASNRANVTGTIYNLDNRVETGDIGTYKVAAGVVDPPTVVISSLDPTAIEGSPNDPSSGLEFTVTRQWVNQPWRPLTVKLNWAGQFNADLLGGLPSQITIPANQYSVKFTAMPTQDGVNEPTETEYVSLADDPSYVTLPGYNAQTLTIFDDPATHHPFAIGSDYIGGDRSGPRTFIQFDEDVGYSISRDDYVLRNLDTNAIIPAANYQVLWSPTINASIVYFTGYPNGQLPDGNYRMTLNKNSVYTWPDTKVLASDVTIDFASLNGDTNADRKVDFTDLLTLAKNYNHDLAGDGGAHLGDFNRDGSVNFSDLLILAKNYGKHLAIPAAPAAIAAAAPAAVTGTNRRTAAAIFGDGAIA